MATAGRTSRVRGWVRDLHLYTGLFISPFVLVFAVSTLLLNHTWRPWEAPADPEVRTLPLGADPPEALGPLELARWIAGRAGIAGEIESLQRRGDLVTIPVGVPGQRLTLRADLAAGTVRIERRGTALWERLIYLHKTPGPHLAGFRGNWVFTRIWRGLVDTTVALLLFSSASGVYLWLLVRAQRRLGLVLLGAGGLIFAGLVTALTT